MVTPVGVESQLWLGEIIVGFTWREIRPTEVVKECRTPFSGRRNRPRFFGNDGLKRPSYE